MSKSPKTRKPASKTRSAKGATDRDTARTPRRSATSRTTGSPSHRRRKGSGVTAKTAARNGTKQALLIDLLGGAEGASVAEMVAKAGWQHHSVRGFLSGTVKKKLGLRVTSAQVEGRGRVYRIPRKR
jgi:Protein of unknown function (DUF3489)